MTRGVSRRGSQVAAAFGSTWVVNSEFDSGGEPSLSRINPASATVVATARVGAGPTGARVKVRDAWRAAG
jgi:hypothetical protein